ncbi:Fungal specific transcription factor domain, partial [Teratosphaeria destructans]
VPWSPILPILHVLSSDRPASSSRWKTADTTPHPLHERDRDYRPWLLAALHRRPHAVGVLGRPLVAQHDSRIGPGQDAGLVVVERYTSAGSPSAFVACYLSLTSQQVKCDERHPRCGPCTRLNRDCDWEHRWNFSPSEQTTRGKYPNVNTEGSIWDPNYRSSASMSPRATRPDDLPPFTSLYTDEDRERKAEMRQPGTYTVVWTPDSFANHSDYSTGSMSPPGSRRMSVQSRRGGFGSPASGRKRSSTSSDPNIVILPKFEEDAAPSLPPSFPPLTPTRSSPENLQRLRITTTPSVASNAVAPSPSTPIASTDEQLISRFRDFIVYRLVQPLLGPQPRGHLTPGSTLDAFELEAARFSPLHHSICALGALNLTSSGHVTMEIALQHYQDALSTAATPTTPSDPLTSDGVFLRHFLLYVYDLCVPAQVDGHGNNMSFAVAHLDSLRRIAVQRHERLEREHLGYIIWRICQLDIEATLLGDGSCDFVRAVTQRNMLQQEQFLPSLGSRLPVPYLPDETPILPLLLRLDHGVHIMAAKIGRLAHGNRTEAAGTPGTSASTIARWQAGVVQLQRELAKFWNETCPPFLGAESPETGSNLPERGRYIFEHALVMYQAAVIYSRTSMFPQQHLMPTATQAELHADTERRCMYVMDLGASHVQERRHDRRHIVFPLFLAGVVTTRLDAKARISDVIEALERNGGIGHNTRQTRRLLQAVIEAQRQALEAGGRIEQVDWMALARSKGLGVVNCGL